MKFKHEAFCHICANQAYIEGVSGPCSGCIPDSAESNWMPIEVDITAAKSTRDASFGIARQCDAIKDMLLEKNRKYGNSAWNRSGYSAELHRLSRSMCVSTTSCHA